MRHRRSRQRGFSLIIVFLLMILMVGVAALLLTTTQTDVAVSGHDREAQIAFYAAEAGVAFAKDWLAPQATGNGGAGTWDKLLTSNGAQLCAVGNGWTPGTALKALNPVSYDPTRASLYQFCVHNNLYDANYNKPVPVGDTADSDAVLVIESYGYGPNGARSHLTVEVTGRPASGVGVSDYAQAAGGGLKQATGEQVTGLAVGNAVKF